MNAEVKWELVLFSEGFYGDLSDQLKLFYENLIEKLLVHRHDSEMLSTGTHYSGRSYQPEAARWVKTNSRELNV